ncbi:hypothetical protein GUJ93_ZPchr0077g7052 [Zizania palustris]|uniref:Pentatricopeptide repeat-containing protein n=1 Tax=Zizania palustris TaxID=103762 RepID=A0A8J5V0G7_ZIZPA|nr:hypothetical protein GUJ93_ZPchr0077g7052 [Zizania palustris]
MEKSGCAPDSRLLNGIIRTLLRKSEVAKAGNYLSKIDENNFAVEASTASLLLSLFSIGGDFLHSFVSRRLLHNVDVGFPLNSQPEGRSGPDDARHLFDEVLLDCDLAKAPNQLLSALARTPPSVASSDGPAFAIELFKRMDRCASPQVAPNGYTYSILIDCYRRAHHPDLGLAIFGRLLKTGLGLNVVAYSTVIDGFFKEGEVDKAYDLFHQMKKQGISPDVVTYNSTIDGLCKSKAMDKLTSYSAR